MKPDLRALLRPLSLVAKGLSSRDPQTGDIAEAPDESPAASFGVPGGMMFLMFMLVLVGATPLMQAVVEEKMQRIAEVLLGSIGPFELMLGKLLGSLLQIGLLLAGTVPIMALGLLLGGVAPLQVLQTVLILATVGFTCATVGGAPAACGPTPDCCTGFCGTNTANVAFCR